jgi:hypothetical protein
MTQDEKFLKMLHIEPCEIPQPKRVRVLGDLEDAETETRAVNFCLDEENHSVTISQEDWSWIVASNRSVYGRLRRAQWAARRFRAQRVWFLLLGAVLGWGAMLLREALRG